MPFDHEDGHCSCGGHTVRRENRATKQQFYGCSNFPKCTNTEPLHRNRIRGDFFTGHDDYVREFAEAFYDGDGR